MTDVHAGALVWVTLTVPALVVIKHARQDLAQLRNVTQHRQPPLWVLFDQCELVDFQLGRLAQNFLGHADLSNVVHQSAQARLLDELTSEWGPFGKQRGKSTHAIAMTARIGILGINRFNERAHGSAEEFALLTVHAFLELHTRHIGKRQAHKVADSSSEVHSLMNVCA